VQFDEPIRIEGKKSEQNLHLLGHDRAKVFRLPDLVNVENVRVVKISEHANFIHKDLQVLHPTFEDSLDGVQLAIERIPNAIN